MDVSGMREEERGALRAEGSARGGPAGAKPSRAIPQ
jgi:hypothetical protein